SAFGQAVDALAIRQRLQKPDQDLAVPEALNLLGRGRLHLRDRVGRIGVGDERRAGFLVGRIEEAGRLAGAALELDLEATAGEPLDAFRNERDAALARSRLARYPNLHARATLRRARGRPSQNRHGAVTQPCGLPE